MTEAGSLTCLRQPSRADNRAPARRKTSPQPDRSALESGLSHRPESTVNHDDQPPRPLPFGITRARAVAPVYRVLAVVVLALVLAWASGLLNLFGIQQQVTQLAGGAGQTVARWLESPEESAVRQRASVVIDDYAAFWGPVFAQAHGEYLSPQVVLFRDGAHSACYPDATPVGMFYCSDDRRLQIDLDFTDALRRQHPQQADLAEHYVTAHQLGHHVQRLLGITREVNERRHNADAATAADLTLRYELQADCLAGIRAQQAGTARPATDAAQIAAAMNAATAIIATQATLTPDRTLADPLNHGSAEQRLRWFNAGLHSGKPDDCATFAAPAL